MRISASIVDARADLMHARLRLFLFFCTLSSFPLPSCSSDNMKVEPNLAGVEVELDPEVEPDLPELVLI